MCIVVLYFGIKFKNSGLKYSLLFIFIHLLAIIYVESLDYSSCLRDLPSSYIRSDVRDHRILKKRKLEVSSLSEYAMNSKKGLGPAATSRWGIRLDKESKHNYGNVAGNEEVGGCNPEYKFVESFFDEEGDGYYWPPKNLLKRSGNFTRLLKEKDGGPYGSYKSLLGEWTLEDGKITLIFDRIQSDPFAPPSNIRIKINNDTNKFPVDYITKKIRNIAACDYIARKLSSMINEINEDNLSRGFKRLGFDMTKPTQYVLERKSIILTNDYVEARIYVHLPANGRRIDGKYSIRLFTQTLPHLVNGALIYEAYDPIKFKKHVDSIEDQQYLRDNLNEYGLAAFVANGSILPRESGTSDKPLDKSAAVPFRSPKSLEVSIDLPNCGNVVGMGIKKGVTVIVGGGYHGKTTLLEAIQFGIYNKVPGDGREFVVSSPNGVKIRAEDGRSISRVDISLFIGNLPNGKMGNDFSTVDASGSTSQAANIMESIELGADLLIIDEDISASNFMYRDHIMDLLVDKNKEPITPFLYLIGQFYDKLGISTILVSGSCGLFINNADIVIQMDEYKCIDKTNDSINISNKYNINEMLNNKFKYDNIINDKIINSRLISRETFKRSHNKIRQRGLNNVQYGVDNIDLSLIEQLVEIGQTCTITNIIIKLEREYQESNNIKLTLRELLEGFYEKWYNNINGLDDVNGFKHFPTGDCTMPRIFEVAAAINRLRCLKINKYIPTEYKQQQYTKVTI